jgi:hypothetical protein
VPSPAKQLAYWLAGLQRSDAVQAKGSVDAGTRGGMRVDVDLRKLPEGALSYEKVTVLYGVRLVLVLGKITPDIF